jgi:hypothetical protein
MVGAAVAISISPTLAAEPVSRKTRMDAARAVSELPMVEISWPVHSKEKFRLWKMAKGDAALATLFVVIASS